MNDRRFDAECRHNRLTKNEPDLGGFMIRAIKKMRNLTFKEFHDIGYGVHTVENWAAGNAKGGFHDIIMICDEFDVDYAAALDTAFRMQADFRLRKRLLRNANMHRCH